MNLLSLFRRGSAPVARERLQILLAHERETRDQPDLLGVLREEILEVIARHVAFDPDKVQITMDRGSHRLDAGRRHRDSQSPPRQRRGIAAIEPARLYGEDGPSTVAMDQRVSLMRTIVFLTQKGGTGKTTLAASLAVAAAQSGERVIALDLDPQASLVHWGERRAAAHAPNRIMVEPLERERLQRLRAILDGLASAGFTLAIFDTAGADGPAVRLITEAADLCLLPARPTRLDMEATASTFRTLFLAKRRAAFVLNQCPVTYRSARAGQAAKGLTELGVLAEPMLATRMDYQDAIAAGLGVTEYDAGGRAAHEIKMLWNWSRAQFDGAETEAKNEAKSERPAEQRANRQAAA